MSYSKSGKKSIFLLLVFACTVISSCSPTIALYDQFAYTQATSIKVDLQNLAGESSSVSYADAKDEIIKVTTELQKAFEYSNGRSKNTISTKQYAILLGENNFYKTFLKTWKTEGKLSEAGADEIKIKIGQLMDQVIELENGKNKGK
jgi:hypothetical protein